jgi:glycosyltransferase 2 family protein
LATAQAAIRRAGRSRTLRLAASATLLAGVALWASRQQAPELPHGRAGFVALGVALLLYTLATLGRGERWRRLLSAAGAKSSTADAYRLTPVGYMGNNILPARAGEAMRVFLLAPRAHTSRTNVLGTIVAERVLDAAVLVALFGVVLATSVEIPFAVEGALLVLLLAAGLVAAIALAGGSRSPLRRWIRRPSLLHLVEEVTLATRSIRGAQAARLVVLSLLVWTAEAGVYLLASDALGTGLSAPEALAVMVLANAAALIPAAPGYLGTFDAAVILAVHATGASHSDSVGYLILLRFLLFIPITIAGLVIYMWKYSGWQRLRRRTAVRTEPSAP